MSISNNENECRQLAENLYNIINKLESESIVAPIALRYIIHYNNICYMNYNDDQKKVINKINNICEHKLGPPIISKLKRKDSLTKTDENIKIYETYNQLNKDIKYFLYKQSKNK